MIYLQRSNKSRRGKLKLALTVVIVFFIFTFLLQTLAPGFSSRVSHFLFSPFWRVQDSFSERAVLLSGFLKSREKIIEENRRLKEELEEQKSKLLRLDVLERENQELRSLLGREGEALGVLASVLRRPPAIFYDTLIVDVGRNLDIEAGNIVLAGEGVVLGEVEDVFDRTSRIKFFSTPGQEVPASISRNDLSLNLLGKGGGDFEINLPQGSDVAVGDIIVFPRIERYVLAEVIEIEEVPVEASVKVFAKSPINISSLSRVVIKSD